MSRARCSYGAVCASATVATMTIPTTATGNLSIVNSIACERPSPLLQGVAQLVAKRSERALGFRLRPVGEVAKLGLLPQSRNRSSAQTNSPVLWIDVEDRDLDVAADRERLRHVAVAVKAGLCRRYQPRASG